MIKNFGIYWDRKVIQWGAKGQGNRGHLKGYMEWKNNGYTGVRDLRDQAAVYVLYEGNDPATHKVIYVGETAQLFLRLRKHTRDGLWNRWSRFSWFGFYETASTDGGGVVYAKSDKKVHEMTIKDVLKISEGMLIKLLEPPLNMKRASWPNATEFFQLPTAVAEAYDDDEEEEQD